MDTVLARMLGLLDRKFHKVQEFCDLTIKQKSILDQENIDGLKKNIESRQMIIDIVNQIDACVVDMETKLQDEFGIAALEKLDNNAAAIKILEVREKTFEMVKEAIEAEIQNKEAGKQIIAKFNTEIQNMKKSVQATRAYSYNKSPNKDNPLSLFMDKQR